MSNYALAGCETLWNYVKHKKQDWVSISELQHFLQKTKCTRYLHSFGQNFQQGKFKSHLKSEVRTVKECRKLFDGCILIYDSGGYQISVNKLERKDLDRFTSLYYDEFLGGYHQYLDRAFILDLPPGPGCEAFADFNDVYQLNLKSYLKASTLPPEIRSKIVYIHHFRTPKLWTIFTKLMRENDLFNKFNFYGTGGLVANQSTDTKISYIISVFPLIQLLNETIKYGRKELDFHILGNATFKDILFYHLIEYHILKTHNIKLTISFDSSGLYGEVMTGRTLRTIDKNLNVSKINMKEAYLGKRFIGSKNLSNREKLREVIFEMCEETGLKTPPEQCLYDVYYWNEKDQARQFHPVIRLYIAFYYLYTYSKTTELSRSLATELYNLYQTNLGAFSQYLGELTRRANFGKITRKQKLKTFGFDKTLNLLTSLDENRCFQLVRQHLGKDEFDLPEERKILTI